MRRLAFLIVFSVLASRTSGLAARAPRPSPSDQPTVTVEIIVHRDNELTSISRAELSKIFLKRLRSWANGEPAEPVDQPADSPVRREFTRRVHEIGVINVEVYWKRMIFSGRALPPRVLASDAEVVEFVRRTRGAVGYVGDDEGLEGVKTLIVVE